MAAMKWSVTSMVTGMNVCEVKLVVCAAAASVVLVATRSLAAWPKMVFRTPVVKVNGAAVCEVRRPLWELGTVAVTAQVMTLVPGVHCGNVKHER